MPDSIDWFNIWISLAIVLFLLGIVAMIMIRILRKDIARYNEMDGCKVAQEESGWKLIHADVFRPPRNGMLLAILLSSGAQLICITLGTFACACVGYLPRGDGDAWFRCAMGLYVLLNGPGGYISARIYKSFGGIEWKSNALLMSTLCPG